MADHLESLIEEACAVGMCFFLAEKGSKYCRHHRSIEEAYQAKQRARAEAKLAEYEKGKVGKC